MAGVEAARLQNRQAPTMERTRRPRLDRPTGRMTQGRTPARTGGGPSPFPTGGPERRCPQSLTGSSTHPLGVLYRHDRLSVFNNLYLALTDTIDLIYQLSNFLLKPRDGGIQATAIC